MELTTRRYEEAVKRKMRTHNPVLRSLAADLLGADAVAELQRMAGDLDLSYNQVANFDLRLGGPSLTRLNWGHTGRFDIADRDVLRPLQYCAMYIEKGCGEKDLDWFARNIVQMSGLHLESLIKRVGRLGSLPLGTALHNLRVRRRVPARTWEQIQKFVGIYNAAKHDVNQPKDTHLYSVEDALAAYFVCRLLGAVLYPMARLETDWTIFDDDC